MTKLAVKKEIGRIPMGGFCYSLHPIKMDNEVEADVFTLMGYKIISVPDNDAERLIGEARAALKHQIEIAEITEKALKGG